MKKPQTEKNKRAKVTEEHKAEAVALKAIWDSTKHETQDVFGETYKIGNQSAVGQFLRGEAPLSMKAARGFAKGLGKPIESFSMRLAKDAYEANSVVRDLSLHKSSSWPFSTVSEEQYFLLSKEDQDWVEDTARKLVVKARGSPPIKQELPERTSEPRAA